jgi:uncharacterized OB-fold protein
VIRPRPTPSPTTAAFWAATAEHRFLLQRCRACGAAQFYPKATCTTCGAADLADEAASGRGTLHTFTVARRATHPAFEGAEPYVVAIVELEEGPTVTGNLVDCAVDGVEIGMAVELCWDEPGPDGISVPLWHPA